MTCARNFQITVTAPPSPPLAYFKLDEADGAITLVDSVAGKNLDLSIGTTVSIPGKIAGGINLGNGISTRFQNGPDAHWVFSGSFTVRFWFTSAGTSTNSYLLGTGVLTQWSVYYMPDFPNMLEFNAQTTGGGIVLDAPVTNDGLWHEYFFWFENGVGCGYRIDNGAAVTAAGVDPLNAAATQTLYLQNTHFWGAGVAIDEIGIWDRKLTDAEMDHDWNSGAGRTYPDAP